MTGMDTRATLFKNEGGLSAGRFGRPNRAVVASGYTTPEDPSMSGGWRPRATRSSPDGSLEFLAPFDGDGEVGASDLARVLGDWSAKERDRSSRIDALRRSIETGVRSAHPASPERPAIGMGRPRPNARGETFRMTAA